MTRARLFRTIAAALASGLITAVATYVLLLSVMGLPRSFVYLYVGGGVFVALLGLTIGVARNWPRPGDESESNGEQIARNDRRTIVGVVGCLIAGVLALVGTWAMVSGFRMLGVAVALVGAGIALYAARSLRGDSP